MIKQVSMYQTSVDVLDNHLGSSQYKVETSKIFNEEEDFGSALSEVKISFLKNFVLECR